MQEYSVERNQSVMRVIGGSAKGQRLTSLPGENTRPTLDRVKESMFNMIQMHLYNAAVLDLFAGSGALGVESLSRGAKECYFVDEHRESMKVIRENLTKTKLINYSTTLLMDFSRALESIQREGKSFDLIFLDPPYGKGLVEEALEIIANGKLLAPEGLVIIEQDKKESLIIERVPYILWKEKKYGNTMVRILKQRSDQ